MKILVVEDEPTLLKSMIDYFSGAEYVCESASTFSDALEKIELYEYDCVILDLMLPGGDGIQLLEELNRQRKEEGVVIISARNATEDKIKGLEMGADDYLAKPFHLPELAARVYSVIRRKKFANTNVVEQNEISIDLRGKKVTVSGKEIVLTKKELDLLLYFMSNKNRVISKSALAEHLSGDIADMFESHDYIYAHIKNLKRKLNEAGCENYLKTIYGTGYKWDI